MVRRRPSLVFSLLVAAILWPAAVHAERPAPNGPADAATLEAAWQRHHELEEQSLFKGLEWRSIGPVRQGGRVVDIEPVPGDPYGFYVAYASGGLWKTTNNGGTFEPLFDHQPTIIMGDVAIDPSDPETVWVGSGENNSSRSSYGGMGVFRSRDGGKTWEQRGLIDSDRIGRIVIDPRDSDHLYVAVLGKLYTPGGTRGVFETRDGGDTWTRILGGENETTGFIDLVAEPSDSKGGTTVLYAAAWERSRRPWNFVEGGTGSGVYKSADGGATWKRLAGGLPRGEHVGRIGLAIAPSRPQTVYAAIDNQEELPESLWDPGDGPLSTNRLRTMSAEQFLAHDADTIEAFIRGNDLDTTLTAEALIAMLENGELTMDALRAELEDANANLFTTNIRGLELWRSDDGGASWRRTHDEPIRDVVYTYGYYFGQLAVAPDDPETVYLEGVPLIKSVDGGKTFSSVHRRGVHVDYHPIWIDPHHPDRMLVGNDGGVDASYDGGDTYFSLDAQPVGQFYTVAVDDADPYNVYGGLQDNGTLKGSSATRWDLGETWQVIGGGDGMYVQIDPRNDRTTYTGFQFGFYRRSGDDDDSDGGGEVRPRDALREPALRYNWTTPVLLSPHNADIVYFGTQMLYRSMDRGVTWTAVSPDLSRYAESEGQRGDVPFATITTISESPETFGLIWAGTDDGMVWVTESGGGVRWREATAGLPADRWVSRIEASRAARERAYLSLNGYRDDDPTPYLYVTEDLGRTWKSIAAGLPAEAINVVREDPVESDVLYVGTDRGVYVSLDRGTSWQALQGALPNVPVHDLAVHRRERELVAGTHGRSVWIVDVLPVQELAIALGSEDGAPDVALYPLEPVSYDRGWRSRRSPWFDDPATYPELRVPFWSAAAGEAELTVLASDENGAGDGAGDGDGDSDARPLRRMTMAVPRGVSTFVWDLLLDPELALPAEQARLAAESGDGDSDERGDDETETSAASGKGRLAKTPWAEALRLDWPLYVTPGTYTVRLTVGAASAETELVVEPPEPFEPRLPEEPPIRGREKDRD